jgi:hypothetical protein
MIQIDDTIVSLDLIEKQFACNLSKCRGMCCVYGESGAPLEEGEIAVLKEIYPAVKQYMTQEGIRAVETQGVYTTDFDNDRVTPLIGDSEDCAYTCTRPENGIVFCAIEKAYLNGETGFRKPVSCHLYPVRITKYNDFEAVNYHRWNICCNALQTGEKTKTPLYVFLKEPLIRKYGEEWYRQLCIAAKAVGG